MGAAAIQAYPGALAARLRGFSTSSLLLKPSALGGYVGIAVATGATGAEGNAGGVADDAEGGGAPPQVTRTRVRVIGPS